MQHTRFVIIILNLVLSSLWFLNRTPERRVVANAPSISATTAPSVASIPVATPVSHAAPSMVTSVPEQALQDFSTWAERYLSAAAAQRAALEK